MGAARAGRSREVSRGSREGVRVLGRTTSPVNPATLTVRARGLEGLDQIVSEPRAPPLTGSLGGVLEESYSLMRVPH